MPETFRAPWWLGNPHLQTLWGSLWRKPPQLMRQRERLWLDDGDFLDLDWHGPRQADAPLVLVLHGLTGSSNSHYVLGLQQQLEERGWASVALNWRGCSGEPNLLPQGYHSGVSADVLRVVQHLRDKRPHSKLYGVGYSLGGNVLLKYLGEQGSNAQLDGAVAVSVPFRLDHCAQRIGQGFSKLYQAHFMRELSAYVQGKVDFFSQQGYAQHAATLRELGSTKGMRTFWDFDGRFTAPLHGYADAADYYQRASSRYFLKHIRTPTLLIQAQDDPFVFAHSLPQAHELAPAVQLELHAKGGHVGFIDGSPGQAGYYLERRIPTWLSQRVKT